MAHGTPDFWGGAPKSTTYALADMAELAARLGSIVTFDRRGDVMFLDSFETGVSSWRLTCLGAGCSYTITPTTTMRGGYAVELIPLNVGDSAALLEKTLYSACLGGLGFEIAFQPVANLKHIELWIDVYTGTHNNNYKTRYDHTTGRLYVQTTGLAWALIATPGVMFEGYTFFTIMKTVIDTLSADYVRILFNEHEYDSSGYPPYITVDASPKRVTITIVAWVNGNNTIKPIIDDAVFTQNEPI